MNRTNLLIGLAALVVGLLAGITGRSVFDQKPEIVEDANNTDHAASDSNKEAELRAKIDQLESENSRLLDELREAEKKPAEENDVSGTVYRIPKKTLLDMNIPTLDYRFRITDEMKEFLHLTDSEVATLNSALAAARNRLQDLQADHASVISRTPNTVTISIEPFAQEGHAVHAQLNQTATDTLGPERAETLMSFVDQYAQDGMSYYGEANEQVAVTARPDGNYVTVNQYNIDGVDHMTSTVSSQIPEEYSNLFDFQVPASNQALTGK
jgi:hypothetical protein